VVTVAALGGGCSSDRPLAYSRAAGLATVSLPSPASAPVAATTAQPSAQVEAPEEGPLTYANAGYRLRATLREVEQPELGQSLWELDLDVTRPTGTTSKLELEQRVRSGCQTASVVVEGVPALGDPRLAMLNLRCDTGEDYLSRDVVTALLFVAEPPAILWQGSGTYANHMDQCEYVDVPVFARGPNGAIRAMQWSEVIQHPPQSPSAPAIPCKPVARQHHNVTEVPIPR
jgi:hypothetical protein